jgi:hypothetical protein
MKISIGHRSDGDVASRFLDANLRLVAFVALSDPDYRPYPGYHGCAGVVSMTERYHSKAVTKAGERGAVVEQGMHRGVPSAAGVRGHAGCPRSGCLTT